MLVYISIEVEGGNGKIDKRWGWDVQGEGGSGVEDDESSTLSQKVATQERKPYLNTSD